MTNDLLKQELFQVKENNYIVSSDSLYYTFARHMLDYIGVEDAVLRDDLIYDIFAEWIEEDRFSFEQLEEFLHITMDDRHLMYGIGTQKDNTVFTRTFSALILASILCKNNQKGFLSPEIIAQTIGRVEEYFVLEKDLRGYVVGSGWAHSVAHGADVINELAKCDSLNKDDLLRLLKILQLKICQGVYVYVDREPDRLSVAVRSILSRMLLDEKDVRIWLESFRSKSYDTWSINIYHQQINIQNFLRSLYFTLKRDDQGYIFIQLIESLILTL